MPLQFTCPFCQASQVIPDQAQAQAFACGKCGKIVKVAAPPSPPLAKPIAPAATAIKPSSPSPPLARPVTAPAHVRPSVRKAKSSIAQYLVVAVTSATMLTGVSLAIFFWPGKEPPAPSSKLQAKADKDKSKTAKDDSGKDMTKTAPPKKIEEPDPEPEPDLEPPAPLLARKMSEWYVGGDGPRVRLDFVGLEPSVEIKELKVIVWTGDVGAPKPASWRKPRVRAGDSSPEEIAVPYKDGRGTVEVPLPSLPKDKVYWLQPALVDGAGKAQWLAVEPWEPAAPPLERRPALLMHKIEAGERKAQVSSQATVTVRDGTDRPYVFNVGVRADLDEDVKADSDGAALHVRLARFQFEFAQDGIPALVEKVLGAALAATSKIKSNWRLDPAGTVSKRTVNLDDVPAAVRKEVSEFDERLAQAFDLLSLHLPNRELRPLESWTHQRPWNKSTLDLTATYEGRRVHQKREEAYLTLHGTLKGQSKTKDGKVEGMALVDLVNGFVLKAELTVETNIVVPFLEPGNVQASGVLEVRLTREAAK